MRILIAGGTGFIGSALCGSLASAGDEVALLTRKSRPSLPFRAALWDGSSLGDWQSALDGADAVVNLAGESVAEGRWTESRKKLLKDSRILPTRALVSAMAGAKVRPKVFVSASAVGYYGDRGGTELTEDSGPGADFLAKLCSDWEAEAMKAKAHGLRVVSLRIGIVLGRGGGALAKMLPPFKLGLGGPLGSGNQWMSWIARDDLVDFIRHLLISEVEGPVNATAPHPVTNHDFSAALGRALRRPAFLPAPAFALRLAFGEMAGMLLGSQKVIPARALKSGYEFRYPDIDSALKAVLA